MKKLAFIVIVFFIISLIDGCGKASVYTTNDVIGSWEQLTTTSRLEKSLFVVDSVGFSLTFKKDGSVDWTTKTRIAQTISSGGTLHGKWELNGDTIKMVFLTSQGKKSIKSESLKDPFYWIFIIESITQNSMEVKVFDKDKKDMNMVLTKQIKQTKYF